MTVVKHETGSSLAIRDDQEFFNDQQLAALQQIGVGDAPNGDLAVFFHQAQRTGLDPFARQLYMVGRWSREGTKYTIQTGIDGFRLIGRRAADARRETLEVSDTEWCGEDGVWRDVWLSKTPPAAARVAIIRNGGRFPAVALFHEYAQTKKDGGLTQMWATKGALMIAKCAEALAWRKAFPQDLSGLYTADEMAQADNAPRQTTGQHSSVRGAVEARTPTASAEPAAPAVTHADVDGCDDVDGLRAMWKHAPTDIRQLIEAKVADLNNIDQATGEVLDAELVDPVDPWAKNTGGAE